jgi:hypothetical protein
MAQSKTTYTYQGVLGNIARSVVMGCTTEATATVFQDFLDDHTKSIIKRRSYASRVALGGEIPVGSDTDWRGVIVMQDETSGNVIRFTIVDPLAADMEDVPGKDGGKRLTAAFLSSFEDAFETATGKSITILEGYVIHKK